jgi:arsenate reductase
MALHHVLFLCTENAGPSILAEALLNHHGQDRFVAYSAGTEPRSEVRAPILQYLEEKGIPSSRLKPKHWSVYQGADAPTFDLVITLNDPINGEVCPRVLGQPSQAYWGLEDPFRGGDSEAVQALKLTEMLAIVEACVAMLIQIPEDGLAKITIKNPGHGIQCIIEDALETASVA